MTQPYIFMSHSSKDREFTTRIAERLQKAGFRCWVDIEDIPDGSTWPREIEKGTLPDEGSVLFGVMAAGTPPGSNQFAFGSGRSIPRHLGARETVGED